MELIDFNNRLKEEIQADAITDGTTIRESFFAYYSNMLLDAEEIDEFNYLPFEGLGKNNRKVQIDGYTFDELDEILSLFIAPVLNNFDFGTLTYTDAEKMFTRAQAFYEDAKLISENCEESSPGYGFAYDCKNKFKNVRKFRIYLFTDQIMSKQIKRIESKNNFGYEFEYHIWDIERLHKIFESGENKEDIHINIREFIPNGIPCLVASKTEDYESYLCNIPGRLLADLYNKYGGRLLEGNVRSFLQTKGKVNKGIRNTILTNPSMFFAYNNGITTTASELKIETIGNQTFITDIKGLQIVNGGQTTASLASALINDTIDNAQEKINQIYVPMKLSLISHDKALEVIPLISKYANSQNKVSDSDLWSNHPFHIKMEEYSRRLTAPATDGNQFGTKWYYERANGQYLQDTYKLTPKGKNSYQLINPKSQMFKKTDFSKYINILEMQPHIASAGGQFSFVKFAESIKNQWDKDSSVFNEEYFRRLVAIMIIFKTTDKIVNEQDWYIGYKANIVAYTISKIIYTIETDYPEYALPFKSIWQKQRISDSFKAQIRSVSKQMFDHLTNESRQAGNVTQWAKYQECWKLAKQIKTIFSKEFIVELEYKSNHIEDKKDAKKEAKNDKKIDAMVIVAQFGIDNFKRLFNWSIERNFFNPIELDFIKVALLMEKNKFPSEKQCVKIVELIDKAKNDSFVAL